MEHLPILINPCWDVVFHRNDGEERPAWQKQTGVSSKRGDQSQDKNPSIGQVFYVTQADDFSGVHRGEEGKTGGTKEKSLRGGESVKKNAKKAQKQGAGE